MKCKPGTDSTSIDLEGCFWFTNDEGSLACSGKTSELPVGSYLQHCKGCQHSDDALKCDTCRNSTDDSFDDDVEGVSFSTAKPCHWIFAEQGELKCQDPFISVHMKDYQKVKFGKLGFPKNLFRLWIVSPEEPSQKLKDALQPIHGKVWILHLTLDKNESNTSQGGVLESLRRLFKFEEEDQSKPLFLLQHTASSTHAKLEVEESSNDDETFASLIKVAHAKMEEVSQPKAEEKDAEHDEL